MRQSVVAHHGRTVIELDCVEVESTGGALVGNVALAGGQGG